MEPSGMPKMAEITRRGRPRSTGGHLRLLDQAAIRREHRQHRARRILIVTVAIIGILVTLPLWVLIALAIKLTSRGPVLYSQVRIGVDTRSTTSGTVDPRRRHDMGGRPFQIYKFRTMTVDAEAATGPVWATKNDTRVTPLGRILREYRLDELPQLINVLRGEMNVVGPRPERPSIFADLREQIPGYQRRQLTRPGITGHAQINLEYDGSIDDVRQKVEYDLEYIERAGFWEDLKIMANTIPVMLFRRGSR
jgi:lipopolysaccharide/colanic/teichoic acid biosynthesis glycosyltransferase